MVTMHDAFGYFARAYDIQIVGVAVESPGQDPSAQEIRALIDAIRAAGVTTLLGEAQLPSKVLEQIAAETGATAVQVIPEIAKIVQSLYVFQRTPSTVDFRRNSPTDPQWWASLQPGWQRERRENFGAQAAGQGRTEGIARVGRRVLSRAAGGRRARPPWGRRNCRNSRGTRSWAGTSPRPSAG